jgi:hypothetical protein
MPSAKMNFPFNIIHSFHQMQSFNQLISSIFISLFLQLIVAIIRVAHFAIGMLVARLFLACPFNAQAQLAGGHIHWQGNTPFGGFPLRFC